MMIQYIPRRIRECKEVVQTSPRRNSLGRIFSLATLLVAAIGAPTSTVLAHGGASAAVQQAERELELLEQQSPENFLQLFNFISEEGRLEPTFVEQARMAVQHYIQARTKIIRSLLMAFINNNEGYDYRGDLDELARLEQAFREDMGVVGEKLPELRTMYEMLNDTSLKLPSFIALKVNQDALQKAEQ